MGGFVGQYHHNVDDKGRISLPSAFRRDAAEAQSFVLVRWEPHYLTLFPEAKWARVQENLLEYRRSAPGAWNHVRMVIAQAAEVSPDKQHRILIPAGLQKAVGIEGSVLVVGNLDRIELWKPERYQRDVESAIDGIEHAHTLFA